MDSVPVKGCKKLATALEITLQTLIAMAALIQKKRAMPILLYVAVLLSLLLVADCVQAPSSSQDTLALQSFQASADPSLRSLNWTGRDPCTGHWIGVSCDERGHVRELVLEGMHLTGPITLLSSLSQLRLLSLKDNAFNGSLPDMTQLRHLKHLYLHNNNLSGPIPDSIAAVTKLLRFTASGNHLSGPIPLAMVSKLTHLVTLRLEDNQLSGELPPVLLVNLSDFNVSHNQFVGSIPLSLEKFGASAFQGNPMLCGRPLLTIPGMVDCEGPTLPKTVPSTQSRAPGVSIEETKGKSGLSARVIIAIVLGSAALFLFISILSATYYWRKYSHRHANERALAPKKTDQELDLTLTQTGANSIKVNPESEDCKQLVFFKNSVTLFELGDLLRASAEMLGKGSFGTAYKAVMENGAVFAVKRMKEVNSFSSKKDFEQKMETIGKLWHPNVLPLRAYYFAKEEKLLIYDYEPNGSLHSLLHGARRPGQVPLDWATRLKIAVGVAKALCYLHHECTWKQKRISHGNIKSSNIVLDENYRPLVADFGLALIMNPISAASSSRVAGYRAPEHADTRRISQPADVYSFGVVMLELLTGKAPASMLHPAAEKGMDLPKWVQSVVREEWTAEVFDNELMLHKNCVEEDMVSMLQIALLCTEPIPERRPKMTVVVALLEKLLFGDRYEFDDNITTSVYQSPSALSEDHALPDL